MGDGSCSGAAPDRRREAELVEESLCRRSSSVQPAQTVSRGGGGDGGGGSQTHEVVACRTEAFKGFVKH